MKAAIYARFSSDQQRETSIADQERVCRGRAEQLKVEVAEVVADTAVSGATKVTARPGGQRLLDLCKSGEVRLILLEGLDRLSRDHVEQETIVRRLEHWGIRIVGVSDGYDSESGQMRKLARGVRGLINETYLDDLRHKVHRGLVGQLKRGLSPGAKTYGYTSVAAATDHRGAPMGFRLTVNEAEAQVVRRIFREFVDGRSAATIAHGLNAEGIVSPSGRLWNMMTIYGTRKFQHGILRRHLYSGVRLWNRSSMKRDPDTGKEVRVDRPESEWLYESCPDLQIVDTQTFERAQARLAEALPGVRRATRKPNLLAGLLVCGHCGSNMVATNPKTFGCSRRITKGKSMCPGVWVHAENARSALLDYVRNVVLSPERLAVIEEETHRYLEQEAARAAERAYAIDKRRVELEVEEKRLIDGIAAVGNSQVLTERLTRAKTALATLRAAVATGGPVRADTQRVAEAVRQRVAKLEELLTDSAEEGRQALREFLGRVPVARDGEDRILKITSTYEPRLKRRNIYQTAGGRHGCNDQVDCKIDRAGHPGRAVEAGCSRTAGMRSSAETSAGGP